MFVVFSCFVVFVVADCGYVLLSGLVFFVCW